MKKVALCVVSCFLCLISPIGAIEAYEPSTHHPEGPYGRERPFNWYYPYTYEYYTPHKAYRPQSRSCYWLYTNGSYVYVCQ